MTICTYPYLLRDDVVKPIPGHDLVVDLQRWIDLMLRFGISFVDMEEQGMRKAKGMGHLLQYVLSDSFREQRRGTRLTDFSFPDY